MLSLDLQSRVPIYRQVENGIIKLILAGVCPEGTKLPSVRSLAMELGANPNTIQKAYQELESQGVICSVGGKGSFVQGKAAAQAVLRGRAVQALAEAARQGVLAGLPREEAAAILAAAYDKKEGVMEG